MQSIEQQAAEAAVRAGAVDAIPVPETAAAITPQDAPEQRRPLRKGDTVVIGGIAYLVKFVDRTTGEVRLREIRIFPKPVDPFVQPASKPVPAGEGELTTPFTDEK